MTIQNGTMSETFNIPSGEGDPFRSVHVEVETGSETIDGETFVEFGSRFRIADGQSIAGFYLGACGYIGEAVLDEITAARADFDAIRRAFAEWVKATESSLSEFEDAMVKEASLAA